MSKNSFENSILIKLYSVLAIVCHLGGCLFLSDIQLLISFSGILYGSIRAGCDDSSVEKTLVYLYTTFSNLVFN